MSDTDNTNDLGQMSEEDVAAFHAQTPYLTEDEAIARDIKLVMPEATDEEIRAAMAETREILSEPWETAPMPRELQEIADQHKDQFLARVSDRVERWPRPELPERVNTSDRRPEVTQRIALDQIDRALAALRADGAARKDWVERQRDAWEKVAKLKEELKQTNADFAYMVAERNTALKQRDDLAGQIERLGNFLMEEFPDAIGRGPEPGSEGATLMAERLLRVTKSTCQLVWSTVVENMAVMVGRTLHAHGVFRLVAEPGAPAEMSEWIERSLAPEGEAQAS